MTEQGILAATQSQTHVEPQAEIAHLLQVQQQIIGGGHFNFGAGCHAPSSKEAAGRHPRVEIARKLRNDASHHSGCPG